MSFNVGQAVRVIQKDASLSRQVTRLSMRLIRATRSAGVPARRRSLSWLQATIVYLNGTSGLVDVLYGDETEECDIPPSRTLAFSAVRLERPSSAFASVLRSLSGLPRLSRAHM